MKLNSAILGITLGVLASAPALADTYPSKQIRLLVPFPPGSAADIIARAMGDDMSQRLGQPIVIDNKPGASGNIAGAEVARAAPDGYTMMLSTINTLSINQHLFKNMTFDPEKAFAPVSLIGRSPNMLVVNGQSPINSVKDLIAAAKAKPGDFTFGSPGNGTSPHLSSELLILKTGIKAVHVPYKGGSQVLTDLAGGQFQFAFIAVSAATPFLKSGRVKGLAVTSAKRVASLPDVPTMAEAGVPDFVVTAWFGLSVPVGTPADAIKTLNQAAAASVADPAVQKRLEETGVQPESSTPDTYADLVQTESKRWAGVVKGANIELQ